jgi:hypothetical protein
MTDQSGLNGPENFKYLLEKIDDVLQNDNSGLAAVSLVCVYDCFDHEYYTGASCAQDYFGRITASRLGSIAGLPSVAKIDALINQLEAHKLFLQSVRKSVADIVGDDDTDSTAITESKPNGEESRKTDQPANTESTAGQGSGEVAQDADNRRSAEFGGFAKVSEYLCLGLGLFDCM